MTDRPKFTVGQRVVTTKCMLVNLDGYYGHVTEVLTDPAWKMPLYYLKITGRVGETAEPWIMMLDPRDLGFWEEQLEAAD